MEKVCLYCNNLFSKKKVTSKKEWEATKYCSKKCYTLSMKGKDILKDHRNTKAWNKGLKMPPKKNKNIIEKQCLECNKLFVVENYRKDIAKFCSHKCSRNNRNKHKTCENRVIRKSKEYRKWREDIFKRDNWTCVSCLIRGAELHPHHIIGFSANKELRFDINNGVTLCKKCHYKFHSTYGYNNIGVEQLNHFINPLKKVA